MMKYNSQKQGLYFTSHIIKTTVSVGFGNVTILNFDHLHGWTDV